jgi:uncharacterized repeat protein (TIGR01451 family)
MPKYNPNSVWGSKKKEDLYTPPPAKPQQTSPAQPARSAPPPQQTKPLTEPFFKKTPIEDFDEPRASKGKAWLLSGIVFFLLIGAGAIYFFLRPSYGPNVSISFTKPSQILVGDPFILTVSFSNYSSNILKNATLALTLPNNVSFAGQSPSQRVMDQTVGDLGPGSVNNQDFNLIVTGDPNTVKHIDTTLTYSTDASSKTQFQTVGGVDLIIGGSAIALNLNTPQTIFSGQNFQGVITYTNNTNHSFNNVELSLDYPPVFSFAESTMAPDSQANDSWSLGTIPAAGTGTITLTGNIVGPPNAIYPLNAMLTGNVMGDTYTLTQQSANLAVGSSPLSLAITLNNASDSVVNAGDSLHYTITYTNNSNVTFQNVVLKTTLVGSMFDFSSLQSNGSFNSIMNTVTWNPANTPAFLNLASGQSGSVNMTLGAKQSFPIRLPSDKNYTLKLNAQISSPTVPPGTAASSTVSTLSVVNNMGGAITLSEKGFWRDAPSGILNSGPYPPKVNQATEYTIHWDITNYSTDADNVTVSATLQSGTTCTGVIKSNVSTSPICNAGTGQITWTIPVVPATTGVIGPPAEAIIQVTNTPAINQVGQTLTLLGPAMLQATDGFTNETLTASGPAITTALPDDTTIPGSQARGVTQ